MAQEFKAGDLALIVGAQKDIGNIGKSCELVELLKPNERSKTLMADGRSVHHDCGEPAWLVFGASLTNPDRFINGFAIRTERYLMKLKGDAQPEQQKSKESEPCA